MDNTEEIYKLVGKLIVDSHLSTLQLQNQLKDSLTEINQLKDMLVQLKDQVDGSQR